MAKYPLGPVHPDQLHRIKNINALRKNAKMLRARVSGGRYDDSDLENFYSLATAAPKRLDIPSPDLADRAGLGANFFLTVSRDRRRPKLENFLRALTAIVEAADERLHDIDRLASSDAVIIADQTLHSRIAINSNELTVLANSLGILARSEIAKLDEQRPNDPDIIDRNAQQRDLLVIFADGFEKLAHSLAAISSSSDKPVAVIKASAVVQTVSKEVNVWWTKNKGEATDWAIRIPALAGGIALLGMAGATMPIATTAMVAMVGGSKAVKAISKMRSKAVPKSKGKNK